MPARAQLSRDDLVAGLQMLVRLQGRKRKTGRATWQFDAAALTIAGVVTNTSPQLAPDAPDLEVLTLAIRLTREEWRAAGIEERVDEARARMKEAVHTAAAALAPFGIDEQALSRLLVDTIRARSTARSSR
jgi:hypothetical protein